GVTETSPWPSLRVMSSGNSCHCSIEHHSAAGGQSVHLRNEVPNCLSFMALEKKQSHKYSLMAALLYGLIQIALLPVWLVVWIFYMAHMIFSSRKLGVS